MTKAFYWEVLDEDRARTLAKLRREAKNLIDRLITFLDATEVDSDFEPNLGYCVPCELDDAEGDYSDLEPDTDREPWLSITEDINHLAACSYAPPRRFYAGNMDDLEA